MHEPKNFEDISENEWLHIFNVNVISSVRLSQRYLSSMIEQNWGRIIFISSESAIQIPKKMIHYDMTKTAQISASRGIAELTKGTNVTSNSILVGPSKSKEVMKLKQKNKSIKEIEESANMIVYIASSLSRATNGSLLRVDNGVVQSAF